MRIDEAKEYIKKYDGFTELKAIGILILAVYEKICGKNDDETNIKR